MATGPAAKRAGKESEAMRFGEEKQARGRGASGRQEMTSGGKAPGRGYSVNSEEIMPVNRYALEGLPCLPGRETSMLVTMPCFTR